MDAKKNEIRTLEGVLAVRELQAGQEGESRTICGRAIVFNSESELLDDFGMTFREIIQPEAVTMDFLMTQDIKLNMLHDRKQTVARWNKGKGSLRLTLTSEGLDFEFDAPKCDLGDRCLEMVRRGDYSGCSFEFYPKDYDVVERGNGKKDVLVKHRSFAKLTALTIGLDPAYTATSVNARELYEETEAGKAEKQAEIEKAEREAAEAAERERIEEEERERILREQRRRARRRRLSERDIENFSY